MMVTLSSNPSYVSQSGTLQMSISLGANFLTGDIITLSVGSSATLGQFSITSPTCTSGTGGITISSCSIIANQASFTITITLPGTYNVLLVNLATFINPFSTTAFQGGTCSIKRGGITIYSASSLSMSGLQPQPFIVTPTIQSSSSLIGDSNSITFTIAFTNRGVVKNNGKITLIFPQWSTTQPMILSGTPNCNGNSPLNTGLTCSFSNNILTVQNLLSSDIITATSMSFTVCCGINPYNGVPKGGFTLTTLDSSNGQIDISLPNQASSMTLTVSNPATFSLSDISISNSPSFVIDELTDLAIVLAIHMPLDANCRLKVTFPADMPVTSDLTTVQVNQGFFDSSSGITTNIAGNYFTYDGCLTAQSTVQSQGNPGLLIVQNVLNKVYLQQTLTFKVELFALSNGYTYNIIQLLTGIPISTLNNGPIASFSLLPTNNVIQETTYYTITLQPTHYMMSLSQIVIIFPPSITLQDSNPCTLTMALSSAITCSLQSNVLTIGQPFGVSGYFLKNNPSFQFSVQSTGKNPDSSKDAGPFIVTTNSIIDGTTTPYIIDTTTFTNVFTPSPYTCAASIIQLSDQTTCTANVVYTMSITPSKEIPINGQLTLVLPTQISTNSLTCQTVINGITNSVTCTISTQTISIQNAFPSGYSTPGTSFQVLLSGINNPSSKDVTDYFKVYTNDSDGYAIESQTSILGVQMLSISTLTKVTVTPTPAPIINGATSSYLIEVISNCILTGTINFQIKFPSELTVPTSSSCTKSTSISSISCINSGQTVTATLTFTSGILQQGNTFSFLVNNVINPSSTTPTSSFTNILITNVANSQIANYINSITTQDTSPATIITKNLLQSTYSLSTSAQYTINYTNINQMPIGSAFKISYPPQINPSSTFTICNVKVGGVLYTMQCSVSSGSNTITVSNTVGQGITNIIGVGSTIQIIMGPITNPVTNTLTVIPTLTMTSYTDSSLTYSIDVISSGLNPLMECKYPCKTCLSDKVSCLSCFQTDSSTLKYLSNKNCVNTCPSGTYADINNICQPCDQRCKTCQTTAQTCLSCNPSPAIYTNLYSNQCYSDCPNGTFSESGICSNCSTSCATCNISNTNCTSCNTANSSAAFLSGNTCISQCPSGSVSLLNVCLNCNSPCVTCIIDTNTCTSCISKPTMKYLYGSTCINSCPSGSVAKGQNCTGCDPNCMICAASNTGICQQCTSLYLLYNNKCYKSCPSGYQPDSVKIQCQAIPKPDPVQNITIINTNPNSSTNGSSNSSSSGYNQYEQQGIRSNSSLIYFPVTISQTVMGGISVASFFKDAASMPFSSSLALWGPLELIAFGAQTYLSYQKQLSQSQIILSSDSQNLTLQNTTNNSNSTQNKRFLQISQSSSNIFPLMLVGSGAAFIIKIITNIIYGIIHYRLIRKDKGYIEHREQYKHTERVIMALSFIFSFKISKFMYCNFFGCDRFYVPYQEPARVHHILTILTIVNMVLTLVPIIFVDVYGLIKYGWGDQFYIMIIETLLLSITIFVFSIIEFKKSKVLKPYRDTTAYSGLPDLTADALLDELRKRFGQNGLDDFLKVLNAGNGPKNIKNNRLNQSMPDLYKELEEDERRLHTDPLDPDEKKRYENQQNPFARSQYPDNCFADPYTTMRQKLDPSKLRIIQTQTGEMDQLGRNGQRLYEKESNDQNDLDKKKRNFKMRGRRDKYYEQVDDEDQTFAEDTLGQLIEPGKKEQITQDKLGKIEEESQHSDDDKQKSSKKIKSSKKGSTNQSPLKSPSRSVKKSQEKNKINKSSEKSQKGNSKMNSPNNKQTEIHEIKESDIEFEEQKLDEGDMANPLDNQDEHLDQKALEESILKLQITTESIPHQDDIKQQSLLDMENQILLQNQDQLEGQVDSDEDNSSRIENMTDPLKKKFNVNDILGDFDRDDKGNIIMLQNQQGQIQDKQGNRVNEKGYLIDGKTGDVVEKELKRKIFNKNDLDEKGEIPPPFNTEKYNFNIHDVRGYFDRDENGNEIIGQKTNQKGQIIDKIGRICNQYGYLVNENGSLIDKRGRIRLHKNQLEQGNLPLLFNYKGKKFDITDIIGDFDKDRKGNIIIRRDKNNIMVDKKGRKVNDKGYLIDNEDNVINKDGKVIFENYVLSKDNEIPKLFPFLKFNIEDIKGTFEMDPLGNPILSKNKEGQLIDDKGRNVNSKGFLIDQNGNIQNIRGKKVFGKSLIEKDGDIPKVFRTGLFRKDSIDSFSQLMSEIEDLEKQHEMEVTNNNNKHSNEKRQDMDENERIAQRIDQIVEEDGDDDELLMKELEDLANGRDSKNNKKKRNGNEDNKSEGGNTSFDSMMEDTPSNYNIANQRLTEIEQMKERMRQANKTGQIISEDLDLENENQAEGKLQKRRRKKKKRPVVKEIEPQERDLLMAKAYGAMSSNQVEKMIQEKRKKDAINAALALKQNILQNASNSRIGSVQSRQRVLTVDHVNNSSLRRIDQTPQNIVKKNGYMQQTANSFKQANGIINQQNSNGALSATRTKNKIPKQKDKEKKKEREYNLTHITNSVSGFYRGDSASEIRSGINDEQNFAQNMPPRKQQKKQLQERKTEEKQNTLTGFKKDSLNDAELDKIYKTAKQFADISMLSDWENDSLLSGNSLNLSQYTGLNRNLDNSKVKGLESIYLQRLEPASKIKQHSQIRLGAGGKGHRNKKNMMTSEDRAKFRVMHHRFHDEPEWHVNEPRDASVISDTKKYLDQKLIEEFGSGHSGSARRKGQSMIRK